MLEKYQTIKRIKTHLNHHQAWVFLMGLSFIAGAPSRADSPSWYCKEVASERHGKTIMSCGIGTGADENAARAAAFDNARSEFLKVCGSSDDCKNHQITTNPKRTTCEPEGKKMKCYRLLEFTIGAEHEASVAKSSNEESSVQAKVREVSKTKENESIVTIQSENVDVKEVFKPFVYSQIKTNPKVYKGMPKAELLKQFGKPQRITEYSSGKTFYWYWYEGKMCDFSTCVVTIFEDSVEKFENFKPEFTDLLK